MTNTTKLTQSKINLAIAMFEDLHSKKVGRIKVEGTNVHLYADEQGLPVPSPEDEQPKLEKPYCPKREIFGLYGLSQNNSMVLLTSCVFDCFVFGEV